jgi:hypothetical protein
VVEVDVFPWGDPVGKDFRPKTAARAAADDRALYVFMETDETDIRAVERDFSVEVWTDSCMEFFLMPDPSCTTRYFNWEFNPMGAMYLSLGTGRHDREDIRLDNYREFFQVKTEVLNEGWRLEYCIPLLFLQRYFPDMELRSGHRMRGNFYKCGEKTLRPHYGCWSPIDLPKPESSAESRMGRGSPPDFHCPDFFGDLMLV